MSYLPIYIYEHFHEVNSLNLCSTFSPHSFQRLSRVKQVQVQAVLLLRCCYNFERLEQSSTVVFHKEVAFKVEFQGLG